MKTEIGITKSNREAVANQLAKLLIDEFVLYAKTKDAHWNIKEAHCYEKHKFFQFQFAQLGRIIDKVAEFIRSIGNYASATLKSVLQLTHPAEAKHEKNDSHGFIKKLLTDHGCIIIYCRENIHQFVKDYRDSGTTDFITDVIKDHEKMTWFLPSHLN